MTDRPTIIDFKKMFASTFRFCPYPEWNKTVYDLGAIVSENEEIYKSLIDENTFQPSASIGTCWDIFTDIVQDGVEEWVQPISYNEGDKISFLSEKAWEWGVYISNKDDNFDSPDYPSTIESPDPENEGQNIDIASWEKTEDLLVGFVTDSMIREAMIEAAVIVPDGSPMDPDEYRLAFLLMTAHWVIYDWQMNNQGLNASGSGGILTSRTAGKMSASYAVSPLLQRNPEWQALLTTPFGVKALTILARYNRGNVLLVPGEFTSY